MSNNRFNRLNSLVSSFSKPIEKTATAQPAPVQEPLEKEAADTKSLAVKFLQCIPANLKLIHVATKSYAQHMALDDAFEDLNDALDEFYECVQGHYVLKDGKRIPLSPKTYSFDSPSDGEVIDAVTTMYKAFISAADAVIDGDSALESSRDNVSNCFQQLAYRLTLK